MRIGLVAPPWATVPPSGYGGIEAVIDVLARGLHHAGHEVLLYTTGDSTCPVPRASVLDRAEGERIGAVTVELRHVIGAYAAMEECEVVHDHTMAGPLLADRFSRHSVVTTVHGPFVPELWDIYRAAAAQVPLIAISHHQASTARGVPIARVIHHGVDVDQFPVGAGDGGYALFLGRMAPDKGVHIAARVARRAQVPLIIAAKMREAAEHHYFEDRVRPLLGSDVEYVGEVAGRAKLNLLAGAMALLNPVAWAEPFGMVMIEALACGTPVVATPMGSAPEIIEERRTGFLRSDEDAMVGALGRVGSLDRADCRKVVEERFSATRMVADHVELYEEVMRGRCGPSSSGAG